MKNEPNELSNVDIVLYALFKIGGIMRHVHTEEVAWEAYQLAPERFSWRLAKFRAMGFPDKTPVRFALESAKKQEYGHLINGRAGGNVGGELEGWSFTPNGARWIKGSEKRIIKSLGQKTLHAPKLETERFIKKIKSDPLYKYYESNKNLEDTSIYMFTDMLVCAPDASRKIIRKKFDQLSSNAEMIGDQGILTFLRFCNEKFQDFLI